MVGRILTSSLYALGIGLYYVGAAPLVRWIGRKNPKVLLYHDCADVETEYTAGLDCTTCPERFAQHLDYISRNYNFVDLATLANGSAPERSVAVTFDDGYASVYRNGFPHLKRHGVPASVYLISSVVDNRELVWVNELNYFLHEYPELARRQVADHFPVSPNGTADDILAACRIYYSVKGMREVLGALREVTGLNQEQHAAKACLYLSWNQIREMQSAGIVFGNHSRTHANLERLTDDEQVDEIVQAQAELDAHLTGVRGFAHPFGHRGPHTARFAGEAGLESVVDVGGYNRPVRSLSIGRVHLVNEPVAGLFARMEIVEPLKGALRELMRKLWQKGEMVPSNEVPSRNALEAAPRQRPD